jgi:CRP-like cAMP-binding protein
MNTVEVLKRCELFLGLDNSDLQKIVDRPSYQERTYDAEEVIFEAGDEARNLYVLDEGQVNLVIKVPTGSPEVIEQIVVRIITKGGVFGWSALVSPYIYTMSALSQASSRVVSINGNELHSLFESDTRLGYEVMSSLIRVIGARVRHIEQLLITGKRSALFDRPRAV